MWWVSAKNGHLLEGNPTLSCSEIHFNFVLFYGRLEAHVWKFKKNKDTDLC